MEVFFQFTQITHQFAPNGPFIHASGSLQPGKALAVQGPSGAGKSTLLRILARLIKPTSGTVIYQDQNWQAIPPRYWRRKIHYLPQKPVMFEGTVRDNLKLPFELDLLGKEGSLDLDKAKLLLTEVGLPLASLDHDARTLSGGEAARVALVRSLLIDPEILLLDEPTAFLDTETGKKVLMYLANWLQNKKNRGLLLVSHKENNLAFFPGMQAVVIQSEGTRG
ncbi:MAG: ATP-binding cassette domain-containing protein [Syntrophomonadaceae bacterium]|nr:ATP-binding cassette domain-containing protein [Syntrophomonadaceae bacterium]